MGNCDIYLTSVDFVYHRKKIGIPYVLSVYIVKWTLHDKTEPFFHAVFALIAMFVVYIIGWAINYYISLSITQKIGVHVRIRTVHDLFEVFKINNTEQSISQWLTHVENIPNVIEKVFYNFIWFIVPISIGMFIVTCFFFYTDIVIIHTY